MDDYIRRSDVMQMLRQYEDNACAPTADVIHAVQELMDRIGKIPAADVAPVVHGRWIDKYDDYSCAECSVCDNFFETTDSGWGSDDSFTRFVKIHGFCPNCGAKMDSPAHDNADRCVCCGDVIPEGRQVCPKCEGRRE